MRSGRPLLSPQPWVLLAFMFGILPLGLSSTEMWDGVVGVQALATNNWMTLKDWLLDSNWYLTYCLFILADFLQQVFGLDYWIVFKMWILLMIVGIAFEVSHLAQRVFEVQKSIALWMPALVFSFPLWYVFFSYTPMLGHLTCVWLALTGYRLIYSDKKIVQATGVVFIALSFQLASNCAFILALELGRWVLSKDKPKWSYGRSALLLLLSFAAFAATRVIWPPLGTYVGYNRFLNPLNLTSWISYAKYSTLFGTWLLLLAPMVTGVWWACRPNGANSAPGISGLWQGLKHKRIVVGVFAVLVLAACAPYIAVGLGSPLFTVNLSASSSVSAVLAGNAASGAIGVWFGGWGARHMLLMMIPMVLFSGWLASLAYQKISPDRDFSRTAISAAFALTIVASLALGLSGHWAKLKRIAKEHTLVQLLATQPPLPHGQVDLLLDKNEDFLSSIYETNYLLYRAYKSTHWAALMLPDNPVVRAWGEEHRRLTLNVEPNDRPKIAGLNMMHNYSWSDTCKTTARVGFSSLSLWDVLWRAEHAPAQLPAAKIEPVSSTCQNTNPFWQVR